MKSFVTTAVSFDDILLIPKHSDIKSRLDPSISTETKLSKNISLKIPIVSTNMSTITEVEMATTMSKMGGAGFLHRFNTMMDNVMMAQRLSDLLIYPIIPSVGIKQEDRDYIKCIIERDIILDAILIDIAHGDSDSVVAMIEYIKEVFPYDIDVIAGNVATEAGFERLAKAGADAVRVGIGGGSCCTTRLVTGHGIPTLQSVLWCFDASEDLGVPMIADGGFKTSGDIVKALACGATSVCLGGMLAGTSATPGDVLTLETGQFKEMYGMSSKKAQDKFKGGLRRGTASEGLDKLVPYKGATEDILDEIVGGIRSGLTYTGARSIPELYNNSDIILLSAGSMKESKLG